MGLMARERLRFYVVFHAASDQTQRAKIGADSITKYSAQLR